MNDEKLIELFKENHKLYEEEEKIRKEILNIQREMYNRAEILGILLGSWKCENTDNPYGVCIYNEDDCCMDNCLYCHEPDERK